MPLFVGIPSALKNYSMKYLRFTMLSIFGTQMLEMHEQGIAKNYVTAILYQRLNLVGIDSVPNTHFRMGEMESLSPAV